MELLPQRLNGSRKESSRQKVPVVRRFMKARTTCVSRTPDRRGLVLVAVAKSPQHRRSGHHSRAVNTTALPVEARQGGFPFTLCARSLTRYTRMESAVSKSLSLPLMFRHAMYNLRGGFLIRPLTIALTLGGAGAFLSWLEEEYPAVSAWVPTALFPSHADPQVAQVILAGIAASIMTVVSIVFAILLMTLTLASMQFSPRIIVSFSRDRVTQWTLGIFLGTFSYCMAALPTARSFPHPFAPVATVLGAMARGLARKKEGSFQTFVSTSSKSSGVGAPFLVFNFCEAGTLFRSP